MKIAIAQLNPTIGDLANNAKKIIEASQFAANQNARLLLTPELSLCGYPPRDLLLDPSFVKSISIELQSLARKLPSQLAILVGIVIPNPCAYLKGEKPLFNSVAWLENGQIKQIFHKRLLPTYDIFDENRYFEPGQQSNYFELFPDPQSSTSVKIGLTICEDLWNNRNFWKRKYYKYDPLEDLLQVGVDLILNLSASPYNIGKQKIREKMIKYSSKHCNTPIIYVNQVGGNDDLIFDGNSFAVNKKGEIVLRSKSFEETIDFINLKVKNNDLSLSRINDEIKIEEEEIWLALVLGVKDYVRKCGFSKVVLGLSGGIDSALVAAIASEALGPENVLALLMPSPYSSQHSIIDAEVLVKNLGINHYKLPIKDIMKSYDTLLESLFKGTEFGIAEENIQSRIRGSLLMAISNKFGHLVLSTGNKSEMAVGYCTLYGDMNGGLAVILDVPKTRVFSLCRWLNREREVIPHSILIKCPSAELKPNQTDQDFLPSYEILDEILERLIHRHQSVSQINEAGFDLITINKVIKLVAGAEFKRKQASPGLRITDRAFGTGWKMPIANRWKTNYS
ncbi:NAD+ synthase [Cyanobacterium sp. uoEpiScrs1]|uniref:NAD+ synthase n=1 Tax=Cyanobacterium sp. uoEpiScrs1 TaxID=2976343 RepID=UPI002269BD0A|nr:NAD+ synthase [Cyanobacterium sp. uoEpiScrs1]